MGLNYRLDLDDPEPRYMPVDDSGRGISLWAQPSTFFGKNLPEGGRERPLLIVLEEAHAYLDPKQMASVAVRRIAKEGRKYGIGMMLVSQRPAEIDQTILSQCGTIFALRLSSSIDRGHVKSAASDNLEGLFATLPVHYKNNPHEWARRPLRRWYTRDCYRWIGRSYLIRWQ